MSRTPLTRRILGGTALMLSGIGVAAAQTTVLFHHDLPDDSAQHQAAEYFKELLEERTEGRYEVEIYPNNELGDDTEVIQQMQSGAVHAAPIPTAKLSGVEPAMQLADLPFLFPDAEITYEVLDGELGDALMERMVERGFHGVGFWESGFKQLTCNTRIDGPEDLAGKDVRVMESALLVKQYEQLGANPIPIAFSETYSALEQGVADCQENPVVSIAKMRFHEVQDHMMLSDHGYLGTAFLYSLVWFEQLPPEDQAIFEEVALEAGAYQREVSNAEFDTYLAEIEDYGNIQIHEFDDDQRAAFEEALRPVHEAFRDEIGGDLMDLAYELIEQAEAER
ncbi:TRAP transporter substrate-binding protein [Aquisalimonas asiatica]|uniref:C4-dicarboxylate-binding protein DctP n=1 Tax=Aquisalimonas asiatica TaxID=406100 RepID=A0A1H8RZK3_9GAMM|nr:TRAP transporter substrate-binding protein [Aquisalimonas asiatica]SEO71795.1 C4-dicarboxylate-binding protein DctP [Aquisalimonas asiatica]